VARPELDLFSAPGRPVSRHSDRRKRRLTNLGLALNMRIAEIKRLDRRKQRLTDVVRALNLRIAEIKRSPTGDRHPAAPVVEQHFPASSKWVLTSYFDTILRA
jgi:hypothetical protein